LLWVECRSIKPHNRSIGSRCGQYDGMRGRPPRQPLLHQLHVMVPGVVQERVDQTAGPDTSISIAITSMMVPAAFTTSTYVQHVADAGHPTHAVRAVRCWAPRKTSQWRSRRAVDEIA
jgi:hypothetical protein